MTATPETTLAAARAIRQHNGVSLIRLLRDLKGAAREPRHKAGDVVEARWLDADANWADGWQVIGCGFGVRLTNNDVEVIER